jgi:predicted phosphoadenosine phosphosulfate sulfurtransferase
VLETFQPYQKNYLEVDVLTAAQERIRWAFDNFKDKILLSYSGGKDSTVLFHLTMDEATKRNRKIGVLFIDWEVQYSLTIDHIKEMFKLYEKYIDIYWIQLPLKTVNGCSQIEPEWISWDETKKSLWVRDKELNSISSPEQLPFYENEMTFEEFVPKFSEWYADGEICADLIGLRTSESLNRFRAIVSDKKQRYKNKPWTTKVSEHTWNVYPIFDWTIDDDWIYFAKSGKLYPELYERMYKAGIPIFNMRVDEPFGDVQRKSLWMYHIIEPVMWAKMVTRIAGANSGALYCRERGAILGNDTLKLPAGHTWESFVMLLLDTMPPKNADHYKNKISVYLRWYKTRGYPDNIPDDADLRGKDPSWKLICKTLLRNDFWCKGLNFSVTKNSAYQKYLDMAKKRREKWGILSDGDIKCNA